MDGDGDMGIQFGLGLVDADETGFEVEGILGGFEEEEVDAAGNQAGGLFLVGGGQLVEGDAAGDGDGFGGGADGAGDEAGAFRGIVVGGGFAGQLGGGVVDLVGLGGQVVLGEDDGGSAEGVGFDDVGAGGEIEAVDVGDDGGTGEVEEFLNPELPPQESTRRILAELNVDSIRRWRVDRGNAGALALG